MSRPSPIDCARVKPRAISTSLNPGASILDDQAGSTLPCLYSDLDRARFGRVGEGVLEERVDHRDQVVAVQPTRWGSSDTDSFSNRPWSPASAAQNLTRSRAASARSD